MDWNEPRSKRPAQRTIISGHCVSTSTSASEVLSLFEYGKWRLLCLLCCVYLVPITCLLFLTSSVIAIHFKRGGDLHTQRDFSNIYDWCHFDHWSKFLATTYMLAAVNSNKHVHITQYAFKVASSTLRGRLTKCTMFFMRCMTLNVSFYTKSHGDAIWWVTKWAWYE